MKNIKLPNATCLKVSLRKMFLTKNSSNSHLLNILLLLCEDVNGQKKLKITKIYIFMENWIKSQHEERTGVKLSSFLRTKISFIEKLFGLSSQLSVSLSHWLFLLICAVEICVYVYLSICMRENCEERKQMTSININKWFFYHTHIRTSSHFSIMSQKYRTWNILSYTLSNASS